MPRRIARLTLLCLLVFAASRAEASAGARGAQGSGEDLKRAADVLAKLRRLEAAAASEDPKSFDRTARRLYPGLFSSVSKLRDGGVKTDLTTAVALYESALRAGGVAADCARELRGLYARLCVGAGGERARLLRAKAQLHASWADAALRHARGERDGATLDTLALVRAERAADRALAEEALRELRELAAGLADVRLSENVSDRLGQIDRLLTSLPRDRAALPLREARAALRDGLYWRLRMEPARALVVGVASYAAEPGALPRLGLRADDAERAAQANLRAALKLINKAQEELGSVNDER